MRGRSNEVVEVMSRRKVDMCGFQEVRWRDARCKLFWVGNDKGIGGVRILLAEKWVEAMFDVKRVSDRIMLIQLVAGEVL